MTRAVETYLRSRIPWTAKFAAKIVATRWPTLRKTMTDLGAFDHGPMTDPRYVRYWIDTHLKRLSGDGLTGQTVLELGPGDSVASALVTYSLGVKESLLIDAAAFATEDIESYRRLWKALDRSDGALPDPTDVSTFEELLRNLRAEYLTEGLGSLQTVASCSIDASWSQAVLEHVRLGEFCRTLRELHRVHRPGTATSHRIDLQDHLDHSLHSLRFPERVWESSVLTQADFYTNRLRRTAVLRAFEAAGFEVDVVAEERWDELPIRRSRLAPPFRELPDEDLLTWQIDIVAYRP